MAQMSYFARKPLTYVIQVTLRVEIFERGGDNSLGDLKRCLDLDAGGGPRVEDRNPRRDERGEADRTKAFAARFQSPRGTGWEAGVSPATSARPGAPGMPLISLRPIFLPAMSRQHALHDGRGGNCKVKVGKIVAKSSPIACGGRGSLRFDLGATAVFTSVKVRWRACRRRGCP
jgi:hypothetical protein